MSTAADPAPEIQSPAAAIRLERVLREQFRTGKEAGRDAESPQLSLYLCRVLLCLKRYVARYAHRMIQTGGTLSDLYVSVTEAFATLAADASISADDEGALGRFAEEHFGWPAADIIADELAAIDSELAAARAASATTPLAELPPLESLRTLFHLSERQLVLLIAAAAPLLSIDLARLYRFAWADFTAKQPTAGFLAELVADSASEVNALIDELRSDRPLARYRLIEQGEAPDWGTPTPLLHCPIRVPNRLLAHLQGTTEPLSGEIADTCELSRPEQALPRDQLILPADTAEQIDVALRRSVADRQGRPRLLMVGSAGSGRATALRTLIAPHRWGVLEVDLDRLRQDDRTFEDGLVEIAREALLQRSLLLIRADELPVRGPELAAIARPLSRVLEPYDGPLAISVTRRIPLLHRYLTGLFEVDVPLPSSEEQRLLWRRAAADSGCRLRSDAPELLTQRFSVTPGAIHRAVDEARTRAALFAAGDDAIELRVSDISEAIRRKTVHALGTIAEPFSTTLDWNDVVLPETILEQLREILSHARHRETVYDRWGFRKKVTYGRGLACLFAGPPGTGKTMMAAVLAQTLGKELYRVDLSRVISKWVGETEKNLGAAFDEAERGQLVLLFDEADALFSKRTSNQSSNDRFANMEINYLLQRMEAYEGMTILTTNKEKSIDEAFRRRIKFKVNFPMPDAKLRARLWRSMIPSDARTELDVPYDYLGERFEMAGGNIKNAAVRAAFYAADGDGVITSQHLFRAAVREAREMGMVVREEGHDEGGWDEHGGWDDQDQ